MYQRSVFRLPTRTRRIHVWSSELHSGPVRDMKAVMSKLLRLDHEHFEEPWDKVHDAVGYLPMRSWWQPCPRPEHMKRIFFEKYRTRSDIAATDVFFCSMTPANCEFYMPFNKSIIVHVPVPPEFGREGARMLRLWYSNLAKIARDPRCVLVANNEYHQRVIKYLTGLDALFIPSYGQYEPAEYVGSAAANDVVLMGGNNWIRFMDSLYAEINVAWNATPPVVKNRTLTLKTLRPGLWVLPVRGHCASSGYCHHTVRQLSDVVLRILPDGDSVVFPPPEDHRRHGRAKPRRRRQCPSLARVLVLHVPRPMVGPFLANESNPNSRDLTSAERIHWWLLADFYRWPHIIYFDSAADLVRKIASTDFDAVSRRMREYNRKTERYIERKWRQVFDRIVPDSQVGTFQTPTDYDTAMQERWGLHAAC